MKFTAEQLDALAETGIFRPSRLNDGKRVDLTSQPFIALDGKSPNEIDDAVRVLRRKQGGFVVQTAIADGAQVPVNTGSFLEDAILKGSNVYRGRRTIDTILPGIALRELELSGAVRPQRALVISEVFSSDTQRSGQTDVFPALIEVEAMRLREFCGPYLRPLGRAALKHPLVAFDRAFRLERGMAYNAPESLEGTARPEQFGARLVQTYMVLANHAAATWAFNHSIPLIYRTFSNPERGAEYTPETDLHFGHRESDANLWMYAHVTSPLRRAPDLVNHIQIGHHLAGLEPPFDPQALDRHTRHLGTYQPMSEETFEPQT